MPVISRVVFLVMTTAGNVFSLDWRILYMSNCRIYSGAEGSVILFVHARGAPFLINVLLFLVPDEK
jgi:hypothetical protein